jgi:hypothetical protein
LTTADPRGPDTQEDEPGQFEMYEAEPPQPAVDLYAAACQNAQAMAMAHQARTAREQGNSVA